MLLFAVLLTLFLWAGQTAATRADAPCAAPLSCERQRTPGEGLPQADLPGLGAGRSRSSGDALRQDHPAPRGFGPSGPSTPGPSLLPAGGPPTGPLPRWLPRAGISWPAISRVSLHVLFCTWLA